MNATPRELHHFLLLDSDAQLQAVLRLHRSGMSDNGIASATRWSVEAVRRALGEARERREQRA